MSIELLLMATICIAASGLPGLLISRRSNAGQWIAAALNVIGSCAGAVGLIAACRGDGPRELNWAWSLPGAHFAIAVDGLSALFLIPMLLISALGSVYGLEYWKQSENPGNGRNLRLCWGILTASMMLVVLARNALVLLMAWEIMALAAFFLVATEDQKPEVRRAAWIYLVAAHVETLSLFACFALLRVASGSFALWPTAGADLPKGIATGIFITGMVGFGLKAGLIPLHVWLPGAHANAPSHVSAILSGVLLKAGVYGMIRVAAFLPHPPIWWGATLLAAGCVTGILGIAFAVAQHDFKRLLAYSSIENVGIITIGVGLAVLGRSAQRPDWILLGMGGALLHVLNHSLFKPLLFMGAGSILHATHTRQMDLLGGLGKTMPRTFGLFTLGAIAITGLPPLNGFVSEFLIYVGLFRTAASGSGSWTWVALGAVALAMIGALAVATFVKLLGAIFAGTARSEHAEHAHDPGIAMVAPMVLLGVCCALIGLVPIAATSLIEHAVAAWDASALQAGVSIRTLVPLNIIAAIAWVLILAAIVAPRLLRRLRGSVGTAGTWDCGFTRPTARIQYTGSSFGQLLTDLFGWALWPRKAIVALGGLFARHTQFNSEVPDTVLDRGLLPTFSLTERILSLARPLQQGTVQLYMVYVLAGLLALLLFAWW